MRKLSLALLGLTVLAGCGTPAYLPQAIDQSVDAQSVPGMLIVKYKPGILSTETVKINQRHGLSQLRTIPRIGAQVMRAKDARKAVAELRKLPQVAYAELNAIETLPPTKNEASVPKLGFFLNFNDPRIPEQWALKTIDAMGAWRHSTGSDKTLLAIVDTGIDYTHPDLAGRVDKGYDFVNNDDDAMDDHSHGTHCAGIAAATAGNGEGIAGLAPNVRLLAVKVLSGSGSGTTEGVAKGIIYAVDRGAKVISLSLGGTGGQQLKQDAIDYAVSKDVLVVAAMGNNGRELKVYPGASEGAMGIGASDEQDLRASFSNYGDWISVAAPGTRVLSTVLNKQYAAKSGTSMATPYAAGLAALVRDRYPALTYQQVRERIEKSADDVGEAGFDKHFGHGRINAAKALAL